MKKFYYSAFAAATLLLATTSCSQDEELVQQSGDMTTFKVELEGASGSRAAGDGQTVDKLYCAVYSADGETLVYPANGNYVTAPVTGGQATLSLPLMKSEKYDIVFWAQKDGSGAYTFTGLTDITVNYPTDGTLQSNQESRDAFFNTLDDFVANGNTTTVRLNRPFAQLNVATAIDDWTEAVRLYHLGGNTGNPVNFSAVTVSNLASSFNAMTGVAGGESGKVTFTMASLPLENGEVQSIYVGEEQKEYKLLAMNYLLMASTKAPDGDNEHQPDTENKAKATVEVDFTLWKDAQTEIVTAKVPAAPIQRNYRTNIIGSFLVGDATKFNIVVDAKFDNDHNVGIILQEDKKLAQIFTAEGLKQLADLVNGTAGRAAEGNSLKGWTVKLENDIDLKNQEWTPIGNSTTKFQGTFDGGGHTISNLMITGNNSNVGLFGFTTDGEIKNLTIRNAEVSGYLEVGVVAGTPYTSKYTNIKVTGDVKVSGFSYVGGVGGKNAYNSWTDITVDVNEGSYVKANSVNENNTAYRTYVGGVCGFSGEGSHVFKNITSNINVEGSTCDVGGLFGIAHYGNSFVNCHASGNVTITNKAGDEGDELEIGGIAGVWHNGGADVTLTDCSFTGKLSSKDVNGVELTEYPNGGLVGKAYSTTGNGKLTINGYASIPANGVGVTADGIYEIYNANGLKWIAKQVNEEKNTFSGKTVKLVADLDLNNEAWMPIGPNADAANKFSGTFDGNGKTIHNLKVETEAGYTAAGLFGSLNGTAKNFTIDGASIKHISTGDPTDNGIAVVAGSIYNKGTIEGVTVKNATVEGNRYVGGISGYTYGNVIDCTVENIILTATPDNTKGSYDNGDKVGGIAGYFASESVYVISGNTVTNATIKGYRDLGGIIGTGNQVATVTNNTVSNSSVTADKTNDYKGDEYVANVAPIVGRITNGSLGENNVAINVTVGVPVSSSSETPCADMNEILEKGDNVVLTEDVDDEAEASNAYGKTGVNQKNGGIIDGNGKRLDVQGATGTWDSAINTTGGTIKNLTVGKAFRGIFVNHNSDHSEKVILENVIFDGTTYTISCDQGTNQGLEATKCTINGWTSYAATIGDVKFVSCSFGEGNGYAFCRPYASTEFVDCDFAEGYEIDARAAVTFENCRLNGVLITKDNLSTLVTSNTDNASVK